MDSAGIVSTLAGQVAQAKARAHEARAGGKDARSITAIDRSLRQTLAFQVQIRDLRDVAMSGFCLVVKETGEAVVRHEERDLPVSQPFLQGLFREAGVELNPGQVVFLDATLIRLLVEEALGALSREEARIRDSKSRLIRASLAVDSLEPGPGPLAGSHPRHAA